MGETLRIFECAQLLGGIDQHIRIGANADASNPILEGACGEDSIAEVCLGDRTQPHYCLAGGDCLELRLGEVSGVHEAPMLIHRHMVHQPLHRPLPGPGDAVVNFLRLLGNMEDADDVTQEVFVRACTSWSALYERGHLSAWLYRIATNLCVDQLRRRKRISWWPLSFRSRTEEAAEDNVLEDATALLADSGGIPEVAERELIQTTLTRMPSEYAVVLVLHAAQGIPYQEVADIVGISPNAAATRISRAKKMFAEYYQRLTKDGVGTRGN